MKQTTVRIGQHTISLSCQAEDVGRVQEAAMLLDERINQLRQDSGIVDRERLTSMAALLTIVELQNASDAKGGTSSNTLTPELQTDLEKLQNRVEQMLEKTQENAPTA